MIQDSLLQQHWEHSTFSIYFCACMSLDQAQMRWRSLGPVLGKGPECPTLKWVDEEAVETMLRPWEVIKSAQTNSASSNCLDPHVKIAGCSCGIRKVLIFLRTPGWSQSVSGLENVARVSWEAHHASGNSTGFVFACHSQKDLSDLQKPGSSARDSGLGGGEWEKGEGRRDRKTHTYTSGTGLCVIVNLKHRNREK